MSSRLTGGQVGPYCVQSIHGRGGVADVYRGAHVESGSVVAIKVLHAEHVGDKDRRRNLESEYELLGQLDHASIPKVKRFGAIGERSALVMEFFEGPTLKALVEGGERFDRVGAVLALINVVAYLHQEGWVHHDLKLENLILRPDGRIGLVDFGNARRDPGKGSIITRWFSRSRRIFGTASYLAPEVIRGGKPTPQSDCYAIGVCMHLLFSGVAHFADTRQTKRLNRMVKEDAPSIATKLPKLPRPIAQVIDRCVERDPADRPVDAVELKRAIRHSLGKPLPEQARKLAALLG